MIHIVGNSVLDMPLRYAPAWSAETADGWTSGNVHFLQHPVDGVLGGCGAATAYVLGKLGQTVLLNTQIGVDVFGQVVRGWLDQAHVQLLGSAAEHTAVNVIPLGEDGSRRSLYYTGLKIDWTQSLDVDCDTFFASGYGQVDAADIEVLTEVFRHMQGRGIRVVFDPGPWFMMRSEKEMMYEAWQCVDVLVGTQDELNTWAKLNTVSDLMTHLGERVRGDVVVKQGGDGATFCRADGDCRHVKTAQVNQAYTVGAGDTFNAGFLFGLGQGDTLPDAVRFAVDIATRAVKRGRGALGAVD